MKSKARMSGRLLMAMRKKTLVRLSRRFETHNIHGYVLDVGPEMFMLAIVSDRIWLDGYECFRIGDIGKLKPRPHAGFVETALRIRGDDKPPHPPVSVASLEDLLHSANAAFPLVTIHRELIDPTVCHIGRVLGVERRRVSMRLIRPEATWEADAKTYRLRDITRVGFGADYEDALHLVGGSLPPS